MAQDLIDNNNRGIYFQSLAELRMKCCKVFGATGFSSDYGLKVIGGSLLMSPQRYTGSNWFEKSEKNIWMIGEYGLYPNFMINNGKNQFSDILNSSDPQVGIYGIFHYGSPTYNANFNRWDESTLGANPPVTNWGGGGGIENYLLYTYVASSTWPYSPIQTPLTLNDANPMSAATFDANYYTTCNLYAQQERAFSGQGDIYPDNLGQLLSSLNFSGQNLSKAVENVLVTSADTNVSFKQISGLWREILTDDSIKGPITPDDEFYLNIASSAISEIVGAQFEKIGFINALSIQDSIVVDALESFDYLIELLDGDTASYSIMLSNKVRLKKGHVLFTVGEYEDASYTFSEVFVNGDSASMEEANYWLCQMDFIDSLEQNILTLVLMDTVFGCEMAFEIPIYPSAKPLNDDRFRKIIEANHKITVYPNPGSDKFYVDVLTNVNTPYTIRIIDMLGKEVLSKEGYTSDEDSTLFISVADISSGVYQFVLNISDKNFVQTVVKTD